MEHQLQKQGAIPSAQGSTASAATIMTSSSSSVPSSTAAPGCAKDGTHRPYQLSGDAAPFIPSFMRNPPQPTTTTTTTTSVSSREHASAQRVPTTTASKEAGAPPHAVRKNKKSKNKKGGDQRRRQEHQTHGVDNNAEFMDWALFLEQVPSKEVDTLMQMLPDEMLCIYNSNLLKFQRELRPRGQAAATGKDAQKPQLKPGEYSSEAIAAAASATFSQMTPDQMLLLGEFISDYSELVGGVDEGEHLFINNDEGMNSDEEEWVLEQMMISGAGGSGGDNTGNSPDGNGDDEKQ